MSLFDAQVATAQYRRNLVLIMLDTSESMGWSLSHNTSGEGILDEQGRTPIRSLNARIPDLIGGIGAVGPMSARGELAIGGYQGETDSPEFRWIDPAESRLVRGRDAPFFPLNAFSDGVLPQFPASGRTPLAAAAIAAIDAVVRRRRELAADEITLQYAPVVFLVSDGRPNPTDDLDEAIRRVHEVAYPSSGAPKALFIAIGTEGADEKTMRRLAPRSYYPLAGVNMSTVIQLITAATHASMKSKAGADHYDQIQLAMQRYGRGFYSAAGD